MVPKPQGNTISARKLYLTGFNLVFACLWVSVFVDAVSNARHGKVQRFLGTEERARWVQTAALIEIVHSATGRSAPSSKHDILTNITLRLDQVTSEHHGPSSCYTRDSSLDGLVLFPF
jgi:hypothetical protein